MLKLSQSKLLVFLFCAASLPRAYPQTTTPLNPCSAPGKLACLIPGLYGDKGLTLPNEFHRAHFLSDFQGNFRPLSGALAGELTRLPLASPASGFTYAFNSATGVFTRSAQSFGPVLTERAETIGRGMFFLGFTYQRFKFESIDGTDLDNVPVVFQHQRGTGPGGSFPAYENDYLTTNNSIDLRVNQFTIFGTVGLTSRIDLAVAVPVLDVRLSVVSDVRIHRTAAPDPRGQAHFFDLNDPNGSTRASYPGTQSASGFGDAILRVKGTLKRWEASSFAVAADIRAPTGDARNFLGAGAWGFRPFVAYSIGLGRIAPHFNAGYEINGNSVLAGNIATGRPGHLSNQFTYAAGADLGLARGVTLAFDVLGARVFKAPRVLHDTFTARAPELSNPSAGLQSYSSIRFANDSFNMNNGSVGAKWNPFDRVLITGNLLFRLDDGGLKAKVVPLVGLSYTFR